MPLLFNVAAGTPGFPSGVHPIDGAFCISDVHQDSGESVDSPPRVQLLGGEAGHDEERYHSV